MTETTAISLPEAARHFGVSVRQLRLAIWKGRIPSPGDVTATTLLTSEWVGSVEKALEAEPQAFTGLFRQKEPAFARFEGTSAWQKYGHRAREYAKFKTGLRHAVA
jgi:hypothetical protein